jgi:hypothetical protein
MNTLKGIMTASDNAKNNHINNEMSFEIMQDKSKDQSLKNLIEIGMPRGAMPLHQDKIPFVQDKTLIINTENDITSSKMKTIKNNIDNSKKNGEQNLSISPEIKNYLNE